MKRHQINDDSDDSFESPHRDHHGRRSFSESKEDFHKTSTNRRRRTLSRSKGHIDALFNQLNDDDDSLSIEKDRVINVSQVPSYSYYNPGLPQNKEEIKLKNYMNSSPFGEFQRNINADRR